MDLHYCKMNAECFRKRKKDNFSEFIKTILVKKEEPGAKTAFILVKFWADNSLLKYTFRDQ